MKIELITQENCPKCEWFKEYVIPALEIKGFKVKEVNALNYSPNYYSKHNIEHTPTLQIWNDDGKLLIMDKGLTLKNVEKTIHEHCEL